LASVTTIGEASGVTMLLRDDIYEALRHDILTCKLPPGVELREQALAERFTVSKSPVREALLRLERERLVQVESRQGYRVTPISVSDAKDVYSLRIILESACGLEAAHNASDAALLELNQFRTVPKGIDPDSFIAYNRNFHCALFACCGNRRMAAVAKDVIEQMDRTTRISVGTIKGHDTSVLVQQHCNIIDALQDRNGRLASKLLREHVNAAAKRLLKGLKQLAVTS
jgi:DNA-binding GntR family transcriptional regulator